MADTYSVKKVTDLTENTVSHDSDLFVFGNEGSSTLRKVSFANLAAWVKTKLNALVSSDIVNNATTSDSSKVASAAVAKSLQDQITTLNSNKVDNTFIKSSGTINHTSYTFDVPSSYCGGVLCYNINGVGSGIGYWVCSNGTVTITSFSGNPTYMQGTYSNNKITISNTAGTSIRDITVIVG